MRRFTATHILSLAVFVSACSSFVGETPVESAPGADGSSPTPSDEPDPTDPPAAACVRVASGNDPINSGSLAGDALFLSGETYTCARDVVVVSEGDLNEVATAAQLAAAVDGPLLFPDPRLAAELGRLKPQRVHIVGSAQVNPPDEAEVIVLDVGGAVDLARRHLGVTEQVSLPAIPDSSTIVETVLAIDAGDRVVVPRLAPEGSVPTSEPALDAKELIAGLAVPTDSDSLWVVDVSEPETILLASAVGHSVDASVATIVGDDVFEYPEVAQIFSGRTLDSARFVGGVPAASEWELTVLANGQQVPGGGFTVLPSEGKRRFVAFYGHPDTVALGALGEQGPEATLERMAPFFEAYAADGSQVIPTFEMIASVASAGPTEGDDYSYEWPPETFLPWIETAEANDGYVMLDLQSGRDDFLTQAMQYEELLEIPFVGLALDPEWRLEPDEVHLRQVGHVEAAEVNQVVNWLADLVRDNGLPQKMMIVHQFRTAMIQNRQDIIERPEIQMIIQMDGDGTEPQKDDTWAALHAEAIDEHWSWGWKNFFDEDEPGPPTPESTMSKEPSPVYVSYQ